MTEHWRVEHGDCRSLLRTLPDQSIDSIVTDPPYELGFMGKTWDSTGIAYQVDVWRECLRVLKHGGHLLSFGGSRTYHRMACAIEDAGFQIRDQIMWVYGSGFPKSLDVSKAIDGLTNETRKVIGRQTKARSRSGNSALPTMGAQTVYKSWEVTAPHRDDAKQWEGWGTALKPAHEPIVLARKPLDGTVAQNVIWYGTGALNIDGCRIAGADTTTRHNNSCSSYMTGKIGEVQPTQDTYITGSSDGRFPANLIHDGSDEVLQLFPDNGSAARFFYCAKANKRDRNEGLDDFPVREAGIKNEAGRGFSETDPHRKIMRQNHHPTVKPTDLMRYLCRLITPPNGLVLDPFCGSGSTGKAAVLEGFRFVGFEQSDDYVAIARARIAYAEQHREG